MATGKIGVSTQNLFPIIKKFLYSDHEIFLREIVSNAVDATQKLKVLASSGEFKGEASNLRVRVKADKEAGTLTVSDSGIGMTREEVEKYINQIAFSGAEEFLEKHKDDAATIIGHFGLGFYSAFMVSDKVEIVYVHQDLNNIPEGFQVPEGRVKPWGTGHAVLSCAEVIDGPFVVINADDYYGTHAFKMAYDFLAQAQEDTVPAQYMMVGYRLENTLTDNGYVSRGVCETDADGYLADINERTHIEKRDGGAAYTEDDGKTWTSLPGDTPVSMNMWGFTGGFMKELVNRFPVFLQKNIPENPLKCEYFLPFVVDELLGEKKATVKVLKSMDKWYGVTYKEDKPVVVAAIQKLKDEGLYPQKLWEEE